MSPTILENSVPLIPSYFSKLYELCFMRAVKQKSKWLTDVSNHGANDIA